MHYFLVREHDAAGQGLFGDHWNGSSTDPDSLKELIKWMVPFRKMIVTGQAGDKTIELVSSGVDAEDLSTSAHRIHEQIIENYIYSMLINIIK